VASSQDAPESFEHIVLAVVDLMSMVSEKATSDLREYLPGEETLGRARISAGNVQDATESLLQVAALAGQSLVDAAARMTQNVAVPFLDDRSSARATPPRTPDASPGELSITAARGAQGRATVCVYNEGTHIAGRLQLRATALSRFGEPVAEIPRANVTWPTQPLPRLAGSAWVDAEVAVDVPSDIPPGDYFGYLHAVVEAGEPPHADPESAGHIPLRVTVVSAKRPGATAGPGSGPAPPT
jgi:hypothetical protein